MPLFSAPLKENDATRDLFGSLASSQDALISARNERKTREEGEAQRQKQAAGGFATGAASTLGALGGLASVIPGGQVVGAGLGVLGAIIGLFK
jgi:hypothetical protein